MTHEQKAAWIRNGIILLLVIAIPVIVFWPNRPKAEEVDPKEAKQITQTGDGKNEEGNKIVNFYNGSTLTEGQIAEVLAEAATQRGGRVVGIIHCHVPGNPESEEMADILNRVARKYGQQVKVVRVDIVAFPEVAKAEKVTRPPKVVMMAGAERACKFQGLWTQAQIERKVDELLAGLDRMSKDWRPAVKGMQPAPNFTPSNP